MKCDTWVTIKIKKPVQLKAGVMYKVFLDGTIEEIHEKKG